MALIHELKIKDPEIESTVTVSALKDKNELEKLKISTDKAKELKNIITQVNEKIEECTIDIKEKPMLDKERENANEANTFKKPMFEDKPATDLGSFGKGRKRTFEQMNNTDKENDGKRNSGEMEKGDTTKENDSHTSNETKEKVDETNGSNKRQKIEE